MSVVDGLCAFMFTLIEGLHRYAVIFMAWRDQSFSEALTSSAKLMRSNLMAGIVTGTLTFS